MATQLLSASDELLGELPVERIHVAVHDASRLGWTVAIPAQDAPKIAYEINVELEMATSLLGPVDLWSGLQTYARLDADGTKTSTTAEGFRRAVVAVSVKLTRARDGFVRHCALIRSSGLSEEVEAQALIQWIDVARITLADARATLLPRAGAHEVGANERRMADEFLSGQLWSALTDCARALFDLSNALEERADQSPDFLEPVEGALASALDDEIGHRRRARLPNAEPANALQLEHLVSRLRWLKRHFEHVLSLEGETYEVIGRVSGWLSALMAMVAYLWFFFWQVALEQRHTATIGSGVVFFALVTAVAYASRERLKEAGRNWLAGRVQHMFAQRVTRYRLPGRRAPVLVAREAFSRSAAQRADPMGPSGPMHDVTVLRFSHRGVVARSQVPEGWSAPHVRLFFRLDLSGLFPRLQDAVRGFATPDPSAGRLTIVDVARNYELDLCARVHVKGETEAVERTLILNKNGLVRLEAY